MYGVFHIRTQAAGSEVRGVHIRARSIVTAAHKAAGRSQYLVVIHEKRRSPSGAVQFRHKAWPIGERNMTRSRGRMTAPATSAATSAGEARPEASGAIWERLGGMLAPFWIAPIYGLWRKENDFGANLVRYSLRAWPISERKQRNSRHKVNGRIHRSCRSPLRPVPPVVAEQSRLILPTLPHAPWSQ